MANSLHTSISLHKFKYVGNAHCITSYDFHYMFKRYIEIYRSDKQLKNIDDLHFIDKININNFLNKIIPMGDIKKDPKLLTPVQINSVDIRTNKFSFYMRIVSEMNKFKNNYKDLSNDHNEYLSIDIIEEPKDLKHEDRDVIFINKDDVSKLVDSVGGSILPETSCKKKIITRDCNIHSIHMQNKEKMSLFDVIDNFIVKTSNLKTMDNSANNKIFKYDVDNRFLYGVSKEIEDVKNYSLFLKKIDTQHMLKQHFNFFGINSIIDSEIMKNINYFEFSSDYNQNIFKLDNKMRSISSYNQNIFKLDDKMRSVSRYNHNIFKLNNKIKFVSGDNHKIFKLNTEMRFTRGDLKYINKIIPKKYYVYRLYKDMQIVKNIYTFLNGHSINMGIIKNDIKFLEEHCESIQVVGYIRFLANNFSTIDIINPSMDTEKILKTDITINNKIKFINGVYEDIAISDVNRLLESKVSKDISITNIDIPEINKLLGNKYRSLSIYNNLKLAKDKYKQRIIKLDSMKFTKKYKNEILISDLLYLQKTYSNIDVNHGFKLYDNFTIHDINKVFINHMLDTLFRDIDILDLRATLDDMPYMTDILNPNVKINKSYVDIDMNNITKDISSTTKAINKSKDLKNVYKNDIHDIDVFIDNEKLLNRMDITDIGIIDDIIRGVEVNRSWWVIEHDSDITDRIIIPNIDYPYEEDPIMGVDKHPISSVEEIAYEDVNYGNEEIYVSIKIMQQMLNIFFMMWHIVKDHYSTLLPKEAIEKTMYVFYYWLNIEEVKDEMLEKKSREDYLRVYRWFRWEAEKVWIKVKDDNINTGLKSMGMLLSEIILYMKNHHYDIVPLTNKNSLIIVDNMLEVFKLKVPDYFRIPLDKKKGKRKCKIEPHKKDKLQNFIKKNN